MGTYWKILLEPVWTDYQCLTQPHIKLYWSAGTHSLNGTGVCQLFCLINFQITCTSIFNKNEITQKYLKNLAIWKIFCVSNAFLQIHLDLVFGKLQRCQYGRTLMSFNFFEMYSWCQFLGCISQNLDQDTCCQYWIFANMGEIQTSSF